MNLNQYQLPAPANWQDFESLCCDLWSRIWDDPNTQKNGRQGQPQHGVDICGRPNRGERWAGVQCKGKDNYTNQTLSVEELYAEVKKARKFTPALAEYVIATSGPKDGKIEQCARKIKEKHLKKGLIALHVWGWADILQHLGEHKDLIAKYYGTLIEHALIGTVGRRGNFLDYIGDEKTVQQPLAPTPTDRQANQAIAYIGETDISLLTQSLITPERQAQLDSMEKLIKGGNPNKALTQLDDCQSRYLNDSHQTVKYRFLTLRGFAHLISGSEERASMEFLDALQYNPHNYIALCNAALAYFLRKDRTEAHNYIEMAIKLNPNSDRAYGLSVQMVSHDTAFNEIVMSVPQANRNSCEVAYALSHVAQMRGMLRDAVLWAEVAVEHDTENNYELKGNLGSLLLQKASNRTADTQNIVLAPSALELLKKGVALLTIAWEQVRDTDMAAHRISWLLNRALGKKTLRDLPGAIADLDQALIICPDNLNCIKYRAAFAAEAGDTPKAISLFQNLWKRPDAPETGLFLALILQADKKVPGAIAVLNELLEKPASDTVKQQAKRLLLRLYLSEGDTRAAKDISEEGLARDQQDILNIVDSAAVLLAEGNTSAARQALDKAKALVKPETTETEVIALASEFIGLKCHAEAAKLYEPLASHEFPTPFTVAFVHSAYQAGVLLDRALEICRSIREKNGPVQQLTQVESAICVEIGDLSGAKIVLEQHLRKFPEDVDTQINLGYVHYHLGDRHAVGAFLKQKPALEQLSVHSGIKLAYLYGQCKHDRQAIDILYELRRHYFNQPEVHEQYVYWMLQRNKDDQSWLNPHEVCINCAVRVKTESEATEIYVIEERRDADYQKREIGVSHAIAQALMHKKVGDTAVIKQTEFCVEKCTITHIDSKYVHAFQESTALYEKLFPGACAFRTFAVSSNGNDGQATNGYDQVLSTISDVSERGQKIVDMYRKGGLPICAFTVLIQKSVLEVMDGLRADPTLGIRCCLGSKEERDSAMTILCTIPTLILDPVAIVSLNALGIADVVANHFAKLTIAQSTIELFEQALRERNMCTGGVMSVGKQGQHYVKYITTPSEVQEAIRQLQSILAFIRSKCEVIPAYGNLAFPRGERLKIERSLREAFFDSICIAAQTDGVLYSDDHYLRSISASQYNVKGVWTQSLLMCMRDNGVFSREEYARMTVQLVCNHYYHTSIDEAIVMYAAEEAQWTRKTPYIEIIRTLQGNMSDGESSIRVASQFISQLWMRQLLWGQKEDLTEAILKAITHGRSPHRVLETLETYVRLFLQLLPVALKDLLDYICAWRRTHIT